MQEDFAKQNLKSNKSFIKDRARIISLSAIGKTGKTKASWMNMIERVFSKFDRDLLKNSNFQTVREAMSRISNYFEKESSFRDWCS